MHDGDVKTAPFIHSYTVTYRFGGDSEHGGIVADEDDAASRRHGSLDDADNVWDRQTREEWPHGEVLEACWRGRELIAERVIFHVNPDKVIEPWCWKAEDSRDLLGMEEVAILVPMNPHAS